MIITKREFIPQCLEVFRKALEEELPKEPLPESDFIEKANEIIYHRVKHIQGGL